MTPLEFAAVQQGTAPTIPAQIISARGASSPSRPPIRSRESGVPLAEEQSEPSTPPRERLLDYFHRPNRRLLRRHPAPRIPAASLACAGMLLLGVAIALAQTSVPPGDAAPPVAAGEGASPTNTAEGPVQREERLREGTEMVDQPGSFRMAGDRIAFFTDLGKGRLVALENLALERVARTIEGNPSPPEWLVTGVITEYRGENLLFIHRAVLRNQASQ